MECQWSPILEQSLFRQGSLENLDGKFKTNHYSRGEDSYHTLYNTILRIARNLLETRENIKTESHSFYHIICDRFSWGSSKIEKKSKMADFQNRQFSKFFRENLTQETKILA